MLEPDVLIDGKYRIVGQIGRGGMGSVYEGENVRIHRRVAIKVLHASIANDKAYVQRFEREAQAAGRIGSDHIVEVLDLGDLPTGDRYMVMEFLEGETLRARMRKLGRMTPKEIFPLVAALLDGLGEAHGAGIIHRDLKPDNVFLCQERRRVLDFVKILDFGVSKFRVIETETVTQTGVMLGTPHYMSPEQARGEKVIDHRADLYSVGVILYKALTSKNPFTADTFNELMFKVVLEDALPVSAHVPDCDPGAVDIVRQAMERKPADRFQAADEFAEVLRSWLEDHGVEVERPRQRASRAMRSGPNTPLTGERSSPFSAPEELAADPVEPSPHAEANDDLPRAGEKRDGFVDADTAVKDDQSMSTKMTSSSVISAINKLPRGGQQIFALLALVVVGAVVAGAVIVLRPTPSDSPSNATSAAAKATATTTTAAQAEPKAESTSEPTAQPSLSATAKATASAAAPAKEPEPRSTMPKRRRGPWTQRPGRASPSTKSAGNANRKPIATPQPTKRVFRDNLD